MAHLKPEGREDKSKSAKKENQQPDASNDYLSNMPNNNGNCIKSENASPT